MPCGFPAADECFVYYKKTRAFTVPWNVREISHDGNIRQEAGHSGRHTHTHMTAETDHHQGLRVIKKVNKHRLMEINDTNHTQALTHFSLFNCNGWNTLVLITHIAALMSFSVKLQSSPCAYHYRWAFKAIIITMTKVLTSTLRWVLLMQ